MKKGVLLLVVLSLNTLFVLPARGTTITFGDVDQDIGNRGPFIESGYEYNAVGTSWSIETNFGAFQLTNPALCTFYGIPSAVGNSVTFNLVDGGTFYFQSVNLLGRLQGFTNDVIEAQGFLDGTEEGSMTLQSSNQTWTTVSATPEFATPIDMLQFEVVQANGSALIIDNVVLSEVPEPRPQLLMAFAALGMLISGPAVPRASLER